MAKILDSFPTNARNSKYNWDEIFDGRVHALTEGEDFTVDSHSFRGALQAAKRRMGVEVRTTKQEQNGKTVIVVQMISSAATESEPTPDESEPAKGETNADKAKKEQANAKRRAARAAARAAKEKVTPNPKVSVAEATADSESK